jgi:hypothetical protein
MGGDMRGVNIGAAIAGVAVVAAIGQPSGNWTGCPWDGVPAAINSAALWDLNGDGTGAVLPFLATDNGLYVKGLGGGTDIGVALFHGSRITTITTWDRDGDGPMTPELVIVAQDAAFAAAEMYSVTFGAGGVLEISLLAIFESDVTGLASYDTDGDGIDELVAVGSFESAVVGGVSVPLTRTAAFDGSGWTQLGTAPNSTCEVAEVVACTPGNSAIPCDGGSTLVIGGFFGQAGGQSADGVACWDDVAGDWGPCGGGSGLSGTIVVRDVAGWETDEGTGLIVAGFGVQVNGAPAGNIAHLGATGWLPFGAGAWGNVEAVATFDVDGDGDAEPVMGALFNLGGVFPYEIVYWDGSAWNLLDGGELTSAGAIRATDFSVLDPQPRGVAGAELMVVGQFDTVDGIVAENLAVWTPDGADGPCSAADVAEPFGTLNFFDVSVFLNLFLAHDAAADLNADGLFNFFDVQVFISIYVQGCP